MLGEAKGGIKSQMSIGIGPGLEKGILGYCLKGGARKTMPELSDKDWSRGKKSQATSTLFLIYSSGNLREETR